MKKEFIYILLFCFLCLSLAGCSANQKSQNKKSDANVQTDGTANGNLSSSNAASEEGELMLYCAADDAKINQYIAEFRKVYKNVKIEKRTFDNVKQMDELIKNELNAGKGPDIIIFPANTGVDVLSMAKKGAFAALDDYMAGDHTLKPEDYLSGTLEAGKVDGKVYVLPLTLTIPVVLYDTASDTGFPLEAMIPYQQFSDAMAENIERLKDNNNCGAIYCYDSFSSLLNSTQIIDTAGTKPDGIDQEALQRVTGDIRTIFDYLDTVTKIYTLNVKSEVDLMKYFECLYSDFADLTHAVWVENNLFREADKSLEISVIGKADGSGIAATASSYGVITKNAGAYAYEFLRAAMDTSAASNTQVTYGMSPNRNNIVEQIEKYKNASSVYQSISMKPLDGDMAEKLMQIYNKITEVKITNNVIRDMYYDSFSPYFDGIKSYEECSREFEQKIGIYAEE